MEEYLTKGCGCGDARCNGNCKKKEGKNCEECGKSADRCICYEEDEEEEYETDDEE